MNRVILHAIFFLLSILVADKSYAGRFDGLVNAYYNGDDYGIGATLFYENNSGILFGLGVPVILNGVGMSSDDFIDSNPPEESGYKIEGWKSTRNPVGLTFFTGYSINTKFKWIIGAGFMSKERSLIVTSAFDGKKYAKENKGRIDFDAETGFLFNYRHLAIMGTYSLERGVGLGIGGFF